MTGRTIAHYQILEKLGEGGMGVVYKARDTHLDRFVAIKVLPPEKVSDPERKRRFVQEAKAASALSHPNIIHVYDIDQAEGTDFISMEFVSGKPLDCLIPRHGIRLNDALKYAVQIADALAAAHAVGIVHRDLKPGNVMVTGDGHVKILDFGLAKLDETLFTSAEDTTHTLQPVTQEGKLVGTAAYMSPEQAEAKPVDARSDIFSFGSLLYEMVTGRRAFGTDSTMSTLGAILYKEPRPLGPNVPHDLEKVITRCLRKEPERRFQHMDDVKVALEELKEESNSGTLASVERPRPRSRRRILWAAAIVGAAALVTAGIWLARSGSLTQTGPLSAVPLTSYPGSEDSPTFSPDGNQVAFSGNVSREDNFDIYVKLIGGESLLRLTSDPARDVRPAWSPDGRTIAFLREFLDRSDVLLVPAIGGPERKLGETRERGPLAWSSDGKWLAFQDLDSGNPADETSSLYALSVETGERRRLTFAPPGGWDFGAAFSPDGRQLVFSRGTTYYLSELWLMPVGADLTPARGAQPITSQHRLAQGAVWAADGSGIVFVSGSATSNELWTIPLSGSRTPRRLEFAGDRVTSPAVSRQGHRLAYARQSADNNIWQIAVREPGADSGKPVSLISSTWTDQAPQYSPDGSRIAFISGRSGHNEVWICKSDGSSPVQLTSMRAQETGTPRWAPDGKRIVFDSNAVGNFEIYVADVSGGKERRLTNHPADDAVAVFSRDGRWIYFASSRTGRFEIWRMPAEGGEPVQVTRNGGWCGTESADGKNLFYAANPWVGSVWRLPLGGGNEQKIAELVIGSSLAATSSGLYFARPPRQGGGNPIEFLSFATGKVETLATTTRPILWGLSISSDGRRIVYDQADEAGSDLMLVENFK